MKRHAHIADVQYFVCSALHTLCENNVSNQVQGGAVRGPSTVSTAMRHCGTAASASACGQAAVRWCSLYCQYSAQLHSGACSVATGAFR